MALKTKSSGLLGPEKSLDEKPVEKPVALADGTVLLELAIYSNYTWHKQTFTKGKAYKFNQKQAMQLMAEMDHGRPIWRMYQKPKPKEAPKNIVIDATEIDVTDIGGEPVHGVDHTEPKHIEVGSEEEIADILSRKDSEGDVTV